MSADRQGLRFLESQAPKVKQACERYLNQSDFQLLSQITSSSAFTRYVGQEIPALSPDIETQLRPVIASLQTYLNLLTATSRYGTGETSALWGFLALLLQAARRTETLLDSTLDILKDLGHNIELLQIHGSSLMRDARAGDGFCEVFDDVVTFIALLTHYLRRNKSGTTASQSWPEIKVRFEELSTKIKKQIESLQERRSALAAAHIPTPSPVTIKVPTPFTHMSPPQPSIPVRAESEGTFPCHNVPYPRNEQIFGRKRELGLIREHLDTDDNDSQMRSFALYGIGGIGKTQLALAYAYEHIDRRTAAVLWVRCETGLSIARSFAAISDLLGLQGRVEDENSDQNRILVMKWLQKTNHQWVMILDNVEFLTLARPCWPVASHGSILVTSRHEITSIDLASSGHEVSIFSKDEGSRLMLDHVNRASYSDTELDAARELSDQVNGLALALITLASQIKIRRKSFQDFLVFYQKYRPAIHKEKRGVERFYDKSLDTCWQTAFDLLDENASNILGVLSFIGPDAIPEQLFVPEYSNALPRQLKFCEDSWLLENALDDLLSSSLIHRDADTKYLSIHRLIQQAYRQHISFAKGQEIFVITAKVLSEGFPKHENGLSLRNEWVRCKLFIQHVLMLCRIWQSNKFVPAYAGEFEDLTKMMCSCSWYLMESGASKECVELMQTALNTCEDKESLYYSHLCNNLGCNEYERAHPESARPYLTKSLERREKLLPPDHPELANSYNNYGNLVLQEFKAGAGEEAVTLFKKAIAIDMLQPEVERNKILHIRHLNLGKSYWLLKSYSEALQHITAARQFAIATFGSDCHFEGTSNFLFGNVYFDQGRIPEAKRAWEVAYKLFAIENMIHPSTSAAQMKLAILAMTIGEASQAVSMLEEAVTICQLNESTKGDQGDSARMRWWLGEALRKKGDIHRAKQQQDIARQIRKDFQGRRFDELPDDGRSYDLMVFVDFW